LRKKSQKRSKPFPHPEHGPDDLAVGQNLLHEAADGVCFFFRWGKEMKRMWREKKKEEQSKG
jgi:hypothetical protein